MMLSARLQAVFDLCELCLTSPSMPADKVIHNYCRSRRYMGSKDRRFVIDCFYHVLRSYHRYLGLFSHHERLIVCAVLLDEGMSLEELMRLCDGQKFNPQPLTQNDVDCLIKRHSQSPYCDDLHIPVDLLPYFKNSLTPQNLKGFIAANLKEASVDLRVNTLKSTTQQVMNDLAAQNIDVELCKLSPLGFRLKKRTNLEELEIFQKGHFDVQDEGSQLIAYLCDAQKGMTVLDYCAGSGGKSLAMACTMENKGKLYLTDLYAWRLARAKDRLKKAGVYNAQINSLEDSQFFKRHKNYFDRVLVDAPCSGTGTWRRNPDLKFKTTPQHLSELCLVQKEILKKTAPLVKKGGYLIYATCSVLTIENQDIMTWFLNDYPHFKEIKTFPHDALNELYQRLKEKSLSELGLTLAPHTTHTDGFYICILSNQAVPITGDDVYSQSE